ncbi:hypothetical protein VTK73DRAFT_3175 [Phialemonium thermophilum]|uniref:Flagellar FliJ protein n=1 Tax=Phialemonium thermophilum TaxID=223376 RepID=A0ABR3X0R8_9PEZI
MALWAYMWKNDERMDEWTRWRDGELRTLRAAQGEMLAGRMREAEEARRQLECDVAAEEGEMRRKHAAERKWFELVREERTRLLGELETVEMENAIFGTYKGALATE